MSEEMVIRNCSPTLAGIKTGNIFFCRFTNREVMVNKIRELNRALSKKGIRIIPLKYTDEKAIIYVFRPRLLTKDLSNNMAGEILKELGYNGRNTSEFVAMLMRKMRCAGEFPHEVGLFLGYPPEDVKGFMENKTEPTTKGFWKVYGDKENAEKLFARYRKCTNIYCDLWEKGKSIDRLTVSAREV